jgi:hypothetical protein
VAIDNKIEEAIEISVKEAGHGEATSRVLISWINSLIEGNETLQNSEDVIKRFDTLFKTINVDE